MYIVQSQGERALYSQVILSCLVRAVAPRGQGSHVPPHGPYCLAL